MFYNLSFNETERDKNKHQKKAFFKNKENNLFFVTVVDEQAVECPCFGLKDRQVCMRTHGFVGPALSKRGRQG